MGEQLDDGLVFAPVRCKRQILTSGEEVGVESGQGGGHRFGDHEDAAQEPDGVFHVAFLMTGARVTVAGRGSVVQLERGKQLRLDDLGPCASAHAGGIVEDQLPGHTCDVFEDGAQPWQTHSAVSPR